MPPDNKSMTNEVIRAVVITGKYAVQSSPSEERNTNYVKGYAECQDHKVNNHPIRAVLSCIYPLLEGMPFETVALDFTTKLLV